MYPLIKKDFLIQKKNVLVSLLLLAFFMVTLSNIGSAGLMLSILAISYNLALGSCALEEKTSSDKMLISLPVRKSTIVLAKYVSVYVFALFAILVNYVLTTLVTLLQLPFQPLWFTVDGLLGALVAVTIYASISMPLIFKWGYTKAKMPNLLIFFGFVFGSTALLKKNAQFSIQLKEFFSIQSSNEMLFLTVIPLVLIVAISYFISLSFYSRREF